MLRLIQFISCRARKVQGPTSISSIHALEQEVGRRSPRAATRPHKQK